MKFDEIIKQKERHHWKVLPNRDEVLEVVYLLLKSLSDKDYENAVNLALFMLFKQFLANLDKNLRSFSVENLDDGHLGEIESYLDAISNPFDVEEDYLNPEFSGKSFTVQKNEQVKIRVPILGFATPVQLQFSLFEADEVYFLKFESIQYSKIF